MSVAGAQAAQAMATHLDETMQLDEVALEKVADVIFAGRWAQAPGAPALKNCVVIKCQCGSETYVLKRHHVVSYLCPNCVQANSYA